MWPAVAVPCVSAPGMLINISLIIRAFVECVSGSNGAIYLIKRSHLIRFRYGRSVHPECVVYGVRHARDRSEMMVFIKMWQQPKIESFFFFSRQHRSGRVMRCTRNPYFSVEAPKIGHKWHFCSFFPPKTHHLFFPQRLCVLLSLRIKNL